MQTNRNLNDIKCSKFYLDKSILLESDELKWDALLRLIKRRCEIAYSIQLYVKVEDGIIIDNKCSSKFVELAELFG